MREGFWLLIGIALLMMSVLALGIILTAASGRW